MRAYIEGQLKLIREDLDREVNRYKDELAGIRETANRDFSPDRVAAIDWASEPSRERDFLWVLGAVKDAQKRADRIVVLQEKYRVLLYALEELDKYEPEGDVSLPDVAREVASNLRLAKSNVARLKLKKDSNEKNMWSGAESAYHITLTGMGYTADQIEAMVK